METALKQENDIHSILSSNQTDDGFQVSTVFKPDIWTNIFREFKTQPGTPFIKNEMIGTTIFTSVPATSPKPDDDDYETGYYNDDYDMVAKAPVTQSFKVKVKIKSVSRFEPKVFLDEDELNQAF